MSTLVATPLGIVGPVTAAAMLAAGKHTPVDATAAAVTVTLPAAAAGAHLSVEKYDTGSNAVTVSGSIRGSASSIALVLAHESVEFVADAAGSWWPIGGHKTLSSLQAIFETAATAAATYAPVGAGSIVATTRKLFDVYGDVTLLFLGDSTIVLWYPALLDQIKALYPHRSIRTYSWNDTTKSYGAAVTYFTGTGTTWINVYDGSKGGTVEEFVYLDAAAKYDTIQPDCFLIGYGLNHGATATAIARLAYRQEWQRLAAVVKASAPTADLICVSQNPRMDAGYQVDLGTVRAQAVRSVAAEMGAAYAPAHDAFAATGNPAAYLNPDGVHPNPAGALLYAAAVGTLFKAGQTSGPEPRVVSPLLAPAVDVAVNGSFARFSGGELDGWTRTNATLSKNTTRYESANGWAVRVQASAAAQSRIFQTLPIGRVRGRVITIAARMWIPAGQSNVTGRVEIATTGGVAQVFVQSPGTQATTRDCWTWEYVSARIPEDAVTATVKVIAGATTEATADVTVDRVTITLGNQPHDTVPVDVVASVTAGSSVAADALTNGQMVPGRDLMTTATIGHTSGTLALAYFTADKDETISTLTVYTGATAAAATPTLCRMGVYSIAANGDGTLVGSTPNDTTLFAATQTVYPKALSASFGKVKGQRYATAILVVTAVTAPSYYGPLAVSAGPASVVSQLAPVTIARITAQTDLPATFTAATAIGYQQRSHMLLS